MVVKELMCENLAIASLLVRVGLLRIAELDWIWWPVRMSTTLDPSETRMSAAMENPDTLRCQVTGWPVARTRASLWVIGPAKQMVDEIMRA